jgi:hypothetical protein
MEPITAIHPGEHLAEELEALTMSAAELTRKIGVPTNRVTHTARNFGSTSRVSTSCAWPSKRSGNRSRLFLL